MNKYGKKRHVFTARLAIVMTSIALISAPVAAGAKKAADVKSAKSAVPADGEKNKSVKQKIAAGEKEKEDITGIPTREYSDEDFRPNPEETSYGWLVFKTILILGMLVGGFYYFFRFVVRRTGMQVLGENVLHVL